MQPSSELLQEDIIKEISAAQIGYFGGPGLMVCPSRSTVEEFVRKIPQHAIITTDRLRQAIAEQFNVQGTCPVTTRKALQAIANDPQNEIAYWRVIKQSGELIDSFPGGVEGHADLLEQEGFTIEHKGKASRVSNFKHSLYQA